jgi:hypothetical protein
MRSPQMVSNWSRCWRTPSASATPVTAWLHPSWVLVCQPVNSRRDAPRGVPVVGMTTVPLVVAVVWWAGLVAVEGGQATGPAMAIDGRGDHGCVLPKQYQRQQTPPADSDGFGRGMVR